MSVDDVTNVSVTIMRGNSDWLVILATRPEGEGKKSNVTDYEFADMHWDKSLVETEVLVTAWLGGRGFAVRKPWHTTELTGSESGAFQTEAEFIRQ
jgi:hypothetical protein